MTSAGGQRSLFISSDGFGSKILRFRDRIRCMCVDDSSGRCGVVTGAAE